MIKKIIVLFYIIIKIDFIHAENIAYVPKIGPSNNGAGKPWPKDRFIRVGELCSIDKLTGLMWRMSIQRYSSFGQVQMFLYNLNDGTDNYQSCGYYDWRIPNVNELKSLINYDYDESSTPANWLVSQGFYVSNNLYWELSRGTINFSDGIISTSGSSSAGFLAVRGGK